MNSHVPISFFQELRSHCHVPRYKLGLSGRYLSVKFILGFLGAKIYHNFIMSFLYQFAEKWNPVFPFGSFPSPIQLFLSFCANCACDTFTFCNITWWIQDVSWAFAMYPLNWRLDVINGPEVFMKVFPPLLLLCVCTLGWGGWVNNIFKFRMKVIKKLNWKICFLGTCVSLFN